MMEKQRGGKDARKRRRNRLGVQIKKGIKERKTVGKMEEREKKNKRLQL